MDAVWAFSILLIALALEQGAAGANGAPQSPQPDKQANYGPDLTLKMRTTSSFHGPYGNNTRVRTDAIYISRGRDRRDTSWSAVQGVAAFSNSSIRDCEQHRWIILAHEPRTYNVQPFPDQAAERAQRQRFAKVEADMKAGRIKATPISEGTPVTTVETIDTGERREIEGLTLRHLRQTETTSGGKEVPQGVRNKTETRDGWYAVLPDSLGCEHGDTAGNGNTSTFTMLRPAIDAPSRIELKGNAPPMLGTAVEETHVTEYSDGTTITDTTELVEISRAPIDANMFTIPRGYREALRTPGGGRDMMQPDTYLNRFRAWWQQLRLRW